jgi:putative transposase
MLSVSRQCKLLNLSKGGLYYAPVGISSLDLELMDQIDRQYLKTPFYGSRRMTAVLNLLGYEVNRKRVQRLMGDMGIEAIYPKPNLSKSVKAHKKYPYLLRGLDIDRPNHVWGCDITYIRIAEGFIYLMAILDLFSRYVLSWRLSTSLDVRFCIEALEEALALGKPEIFNTDQGVQFTSEDWTEKLIDKGVRISMDSKGRALDNIFVERLWRSVKYEEVYLKSYSSVREASESLAKYFRFYNEERENVNYFV